MLPEEVKHYHETWSKCSFCGAYNGKFGRLLEQHRPRCFYKGNANSFNVIVPNHSQMIEEDDKVFLKMIWAENELKEANKKIQKLEKIINETVRTS